MDNSSNQIKDIAIPKGKRWIRICGPNSHPNFDFRFDSISDLVDRIDSLQRAVAQDRGETHRLREEIRAFLQRGHW